MADKGDGPIVLRTYLAADGQPVFSETSIRHRCGHREIYKGASIPRWEMVRRCQALCPRCQRAEREAV